MHRKSARARITAAAELGKLTKRAQFQDAPSAYSDGFIQKIDLQAALNDISNIYDISSNPADYILVVARAVTAELPDSPNPNENGDSFPRDELLRFDHRLARRVYKTFDLKPNHLNHRAENPKTARGFIVDSTYNDADSNDQFVECLIAIDASKDPVYAEGIRKGDIDSFSMGCIAEYTVCSICANKATSKWQFCAHIRNGKLKTFKDASSQQDRLAYEICGGVCFEELSAVDQPADPKALMQEILHPMASAPQLAEESTVLRIDSRLSKLEAAVHGATMDKREEEVRKTAQAAAPPPSTPPVPAAPVTAVEEEDVDEPMPFAGDGEAVVPDELGMDDPPTMDEFRKEKDADSGMGGRTDDEVGIMAVTCRKLSTRYAKKYEDIQVTSTKAGNFRVFNASTGENLYGMRPLVKIGSADDAKQYCEIVARHIAHYGLAEAMKKLSAIRYPKHAQVLEHADDNAVDERPATQDPASTSPDDVLEDQRPGMPGSTKTDQETNMEQDRPSGPSTAIDDRGSNMEDAAEAGDLSSSRGPDSNMRDERDEYTVSGGDSGVLAEEEHNHEERVGKVAEFYQKKITALETEHQKRQAELEGRIEKLAAQKARAMMQRLERCLRIASEYQRLNREESPLKIEMADALLQPFDINDRERFAGINTELTGILVERGMGAGMPAHLESVVKRAKEIYSYDDKHLQDIENDLRRARPTPVVSGTTSGRRNDRSVEREIEAIEGNPVFKTADWQEFSDESLEEMTPVESRKRAIRESLGTPAFVRRFSR